jgi:hypothetical protein
MKVHSLNSTQWNYIDAVVLLFAVLCLLGCSKHTAATPKGTATQATFADPAEAGQALLAAMQTDDQNALAQILGPKSPAILSSGDPTEDRAGERSFVAKYHRMNRWAKMTDGSQVLYIGADNYPFPIPLAQDKSSQWYFDTAAGEEELLARRIGRNELLAIDASTSIGNAEELYHREPRDGSPVRQYTSRILSSPGKQDGLHWAAPPDQAPGPLGRVEEFAKDAVSSPSDGGSVVFDGYSFRILTGQGADAEGGVRSYVVNGKMTGGFAVLAYPVKYQDSGIMTFLMNREGVVYQKDLGEKTTEIAASIQDYNPADGWTPAE